MYFLMTDIHGHGNFILWEHIVQFIILIATICIYFYLRVPLKNSKWWHEKKWLAIICIYFYLKAILKNSKWWHEIERKWHEKKWLAIQKGDSQSKIASIVGKPDSIENENKDSEKVTWIYDCGSEGKRAITFKDGITEKIEVKY